MKRKGWKEDRKGLLLGRVLEKMPRWRGTLRRVGTLRLWGKGSRIRRVSQRAQYRRVVLLGRAAVSDGMGAWLAWGPQVWQRRASAASWADCSPTTGPNLKYWLQLKVDWGDEGRWQVAKCAQVWLLPNSNLFLPQCPVPGFGGMRKRGKSLYPSRFFRLLRIKLTWNIKSNLISYVQWTPHLAR